MSEEVRIRATAKGGLLLVEGTFEILTAEPANDRPGAIVLLLADPQGRRVSLQLPSLVFAAVPSDRELYGHHC